MDADVEDAEESERAAAQALKEYKQCRERRRQLEVEIRDLEKRVKSLTVAIPKLEMEIAGVETTRTELTRSIPELREASKMSPEDEVSVWCARSERRGRVAMSGEERSDGAA